MQKTLVPTLIVLAGALVSWQFGFAYAIPVYVVALVVAALLHRLNITESKRHRNIPVNDSSLESIPIVMQRGSVYSLSTNDPDELIERIV